MPFGGHIDSSSSTISCFSSGAARLSCTRYRRGCAWSSSTDSAGSRLSTVLRVGSACISLPLLPLHHQLGCFRGSPLLEREPLEEVEQLVVVDAVALGGRHDAGGGLPRILAQVVTHGVLGQPPRGCDET